MARSGGSIKSVLVREQRSETDSTWCNTIWDFCTKHYSTFIQRIWMKTVIFPSEFGAEWHWSYDISLHISHSFTGWWYCDEFFNFTLVLPAQQILIIYPLLWIFTLGGFMPLIKYYLWTMKNYSFKFLKWILHNSEKMQNSYSPII